MPLPPNSTISLQGHSRPGEGVTTMPKIAMVVRLSEETLDALQNLSAGDRMDFEFGDKPGIFVRDQHFPMRYDREKENQELFIRTTMAARPNAPLKLNANVVGKFAVEKVLSDKLTQRLHNATAAAMKQKAERKTIMVDSAPQIPTATSQKPVPKRKAPPKSTPKSTTTIVKSYATPASNLTSTATAPEPVSLPKELAIVYRQRLIHYLALGAATVQDIFKEFGGTDIEYNLRSGIMELLNEVAEQEQVPRKSASSQPVKWQLKRVSWLEVRPYQYQAYTDNVRTKVARHARNWLGSMKIPESDPAWDHVKFRDNGQGGVSSSATSAQRAINGTTTAIAKGKAKVAKERKTMQPPSRPTLVPVASSLPVRPDINQGRASTPLRSAKGKDKEADAEKEEGELSASQTPPRIPVVPADRRPPGSRLNGSSTPTMQPPPVPVSPRPTGSSQATSVISQKRIAPVEARGARRLLPELNESTRTAAPTPNAVPPERKALVQPKREGVQPKKERPSAPKGENGKNGNPSGSSIHSSKERETVRRERERERESDRENLRVVQREKKQESDRESARARDGERVPKDKDVGREREREAERPRMKVKEREQPPSRPLTKPIAKRKASESSGDESSDWGYEDRRKSAGASTSLAVKKVKRDRETAPVKAPTTSLKASKRDSPTPKQRVKRDASPLPPSKPKPAIERKIITVTASPVPKIKKESKADALPRATTTKSSKRQRSSIDFTSSEEEEEVPKAKNSKTSTKMVISSSQALPTKHSSTTASAVPAARSRPIKRPTNQSERELLRSRYSSTYNEYLMVLQSLIAQKSKFAAAIKSGSQSSSGGESDEDIDMMPLDEVEELKARHQRLHDELEDIKKSFTRRPRLAGNSHAHEIDARLLIAKTPPPGSDSFFELELALFPLSSFSLLVGVLFLDVDIPCPVSSILSASTIASTSPSLTDHPAQTPPASLHIRAQPSRPLLLMGFTLGSLAVISGFRPLEPSSFSRISALFELRSMLLSVVVFFVLLVLAYLTNPSETSFRAFLTEQAFRHHLSRLDDTDAQDELESAGVAAKPDPLSRRGLSNSFKNRTINTYASPPFAFASRASVSLRTPKHVVWSFGILSIAAVVPISSSRRPLPSGTQREDGIATRTDRDGRSSSSASLVSNTWFVGAFGMWFWTANLDAFWRDAGLIAKDEVDGTITGVLEIKALDRSDDASRTSFTPYGNGNSTHGSRRIPKLRSRERFTNQNGTALSHRSQTPPPLPKSASLPLHAKRGSHTSSPEKLSSNSSHHTSTSFATPSVSSAAVQLPIPNTPESRLISSSSLPVLASSTYPSACPSRSPSATFTSSPLIAEILRQISSSQIAIQELRTQLTDFDTPSSQTRSALDDELERQRERKRADDAAKLELKAQTKFLEDQKRATEATRRDAEKRLKAVRTEKDKTDARIERFEREIIRLQSQMEAHGSAIVASGVESSALAADLEEQVDVKRSEIRVVEDEVAQLSSRLRDMEEKVADEERRLEDAKAEANARKQAQSEAQYEMQGYQQVDTTQFSAFSTEDEFTLAQARASDYSSVEAAKALSPSPHVQIIAPSDARTHQASRPVPKVPAALDSNLANGFSSFIPEINGRHAFSDTPTKFSPFSNELASPGPFSPTGESLIPSSLYESLGMAIPDKLSDSPINASGMDISRSFQSDDDMILDRNWPNHRNRSAGDVGQPVILSSQSADARNVSPLSSAGSTHGFDAFEMSHPVRKRVSSLRMDTQRASFPLRLPAVEHAPTHSVTHGVVDVNVGRPEATSDATNRHYSWFTSNKDKSAKPLEKKGLNPDAKEFSLSKEKERSFSAFLSRSRGSGNGSNSGTSSTPSTASQSTPEPPSLIGSPASSTASAVKNTSPESQLTPPARTAGSLLGLGSSWFGSSHAFAPTPLEREQLNRALGGTANSSLDKLDRLPSLPTSPQPKHALAPSHAVSIVAPRPWDLSAAFGRRANANGSKASSAFSPFDDEQHPTGSGSHSGSDSPSDESTNAAGDGVVGKAARV